MPSPVGADRHRRLAGQHAGAGARSGDAELVAERGHGGDEVECGADGPLGVVLRRRRRAPDRHHRVADELLDGAAVALDQAPARVEVAREELADLLGVARRRGAVKPTRSANSTQTSRRSATGAAVPAAPAGVVAVTAAPHSPQNRSPASSGAPQAEHPLASDPPQAEQNLRPSRLLTPQCAQETIERETTARSCAWSSHRRAAVTRLDRQCTWEDSNLRPDARHGLGRRHARAAASTRSALAGRIGLATPGERRQSLRFRM